ncbi:hypothetical protein LCGC14_2899750 [marine sediment metagenome]|uniref:Uncharacterized protein n=1 Tax=marine sediment metagenome TaxID=412755 RepID=A0A0F9AKZ9_9ZZZZ
MNDDTPPKYQIHEKTPNEELDQVPNKKLLKKIKAERAKLEREKTEWAKVVNSIEGYKETIRDLEKKRKFKEFEIRDFLNQRERLTKELNGMKKEVVTQRNRLEDIKRLQNNILNEKKDLEKKKSMAESRIKEIKTKTPGMERREDALKRTIEISKRN